MSVKNIRYDDFVYVYECVHVTKRLETLVHPQIMDGSFIPDSQKVVGIVLGKGCKLLCKANSLVSNRKPILANPLPFIRTVYRRMTENFQMLRIHELHSYGSFRGKVMILAMTPPMVPTL